VTSRAVNRRRSALAVASTVATVGLLAAGCGSHGPDAASATGGSMSEGGAVGSIQGRAPTGAVPHQLADRPSPAALDSQVQQRAVISTGDLQLVANDVSTARAKVDAVLAADGGHVADENTITNKKGVVTDTHLVLRVPSTEFDAAMQKLAGIATLRSAQRKGVDVTTEVIDVKARIAAERAGVRRLRQLVSRSADLRALLAVERALTARQGELESLRQQQAYLADQTSLATITVDISRRTTPPPPVGHRGGFIGGLQHGWQAFTATVNGVLVAVGAALPFAIVVALIGIPAWLVMRRLRRSREQEAPPEPAET
jgi:hypothetical protein